MGVEKKVVYAILKKNSLEYSVRLLSIRVLKCTEHNLYRCVAVETELSYHCVGLWNVVNVNSCKRNSPLRSRRTV